MTGDYAAYLASDRWAVTRLGALHRAGWRCRCGSRSCLQVHHLTYARVGAELPDDLVVLCRNCHQRVHGIAS